MKGQVTEHSNYIGFSFFFFCENASSLLIASEVSLCLIQNIPAERSDRCRFTD